MQTRFDRQERLHRVVRLIRPIHLNISRTFDRLLDASGLSLAQRAVLELLIDGGPRTVPDAARALSMKRQFVQRIVADLLDAGLVERGKAPERPRAHLYAASASGQSAYATVHARELALLREHLGDINTTEVIVTMRVLNRLAACFEALGAAER